jgi:hypothetical protein
MTSSLPDKRVKLGTQPHRMNDDRILAIQVKHADLQRRAIAGRADEHGQVIIHVDLPDGGTDSMPDVGIVYPVLAGWRADPHRSSLSFRAYRVNDCCLLISSRFVNQIRQPIPRR